MLETSLTEVSRPVQSCAFSLTFEQAYQGIVKSAKVLFHPLNLPALCSECRRDIRAALLRINNAEQAVIVYFKQQEEADEWYDQH